ncbi:aminotransferase class I/II-fold pyridoxal phosphate-dependent enzyme [Mumia zhuanghuii]|uniref:cysteine-S-conjugate beta-lyase n=2 Tax=Mumia TaxID=1546255 RepID=A0ABW1QNA5_9ACTN|nr:MULTISPECIES: aminotransferase class I/II-fold pyridoxal phosphate-dependent enzyme [Mumia]KAA1419770.1 aminotransferase class I/II-fold pyridoxal phosphate-dependent enzyme [Mumia zhuanghuii]
MDTVNPLEQLTLDDLRTRTSAKWRVYPPDVLPSFVAEMDVPLAEPVVRAVTDAVRRGDTGYPSGTGYAEALAAFASKRWTWDGITVARTAMVADVMTGLTEVVRLVTEPGSPVVVSPPVYPPFYGFMAAADRDVVEAPLGADARLDLETLGDAFERAAASGRPAAYLLCNPHNPTGVAHTPAELAGVARLARAFGVRVVADEIHAPVVLDGSSFTPYLSVDGAEDAFSVMSASKAWNLAGMKAAIVLAGESAESDLARMPEVVAHGASHLGVVAHTAALREGAEWLDAVLAGLAVNRDHLAAELTARLPEVGFRAPEATYLAWLDCRGLGLGDDPAEVFLERGRVALGSGLPFGAGGAGHVRVTTATSRAVLSDIVERMATAVA